MFHKITPYISNRSIYFINKNCLIMTTIFMVNCAKSRKNSVWKNEMHKHLFRHRRDTAGREQKLQVELLPRVSKKILKSQSCLSNHIRVLTWPQASSPIQIQNSSRALGDTQQKLVREKEKRKAQKQKPLQPAFCCL